MCALAAHVRDKTPCTAKAVAYLGMAFLRIALSDDPGELGSIMAKL